MIKLKVDSLEQIANHPEWPQIGDFCKAYTLDGIIYGHIKEIHTDGWEEVLGISAGCTFVEYPNIEIPYWDNVLVKVSND